MGRYDDDSKFTADSGYVSISRLSSSTCQACYQHHIWLDDVMIKPDSSRIPTPNQDMPGDVMNLYDEAREVFNKSPRSSAALLRLALQHLCIHLGEEGKNINEDIKQLVNKGLDLRVQKALDIVRVTGNNAVHPGELDMVDNSDIAARLFGLLNFIVDAMITQPAQIDSFFSELPESSRKL